jgi:ADP-ribosylglycohydrolase
MNMIDYAITARNSLEGLSVGDAFGDSLFFQTKNLDDIGLKRSLPLGPWEYTDDTQMALSIVEILCRYGKINQEQLAFSFARHFERQRGYGSAMYDLIPKFLSSESCLNEAKALFNGTGSYGNGSAMRVAPLGAFFYDDLQKVVENARLSSEITHSHPEALAGAVAVAVGAACAARFRIEKKPPRSDRFFQLVLPNIPQSLVREQVEKTAGFPSTISIREAVSAVGNGAETAAYDTVPFALWCAARHMDNFEEAIWQCASGKGDMDTTCAITGGIVASYTGIEGIPAEWLQRREPLPAWPFSDVK